MNKVFIYLLFLIVMSSCQKKSQDIIEIYLTKERIPHKVGVPFDEMSKYVDVDLTEGFFGRYDYFFVSYDTINKKPIYLGEFEVKKEDLEEEPFITNDEILGFDFEKSELVINNKATNRISKEIKELQQFVVCVNNKPQIKGYFQNVMSSKIFETFNLFYFKSQDELKDENYHLILHSGVAKNEFIIPDFQTTNPEFYNAFQTRNQENNLFQQ